MDTPRCEGCGLPAKLICFCANSLFCELCVGKHLIDVPALSHKPCLLQSEETKSHEIYLSTEEEVKAREAISAAIASKLAGEVEKVRALRPVVIEYVSMAVELVARQLPELAEKLGREMLSVCDAYQSLLESALAHFEGRNQHCSNEAVRLLKSCYSLAEVEATEILTCTLHVREMNVERMLRAGLTFDIAVNKPNASRKQSPSTLSKLRPAGRSIIPKCYRATKPTNGRLSFSRAEATQSLDSSVDHEYSRTDVFTERMSQKLQSLQPPKAPTGDFFKRGSPGDSSILDTCNEEDFGKVEDPSPDPPLQRFSLGVATLRRLPPDVGDKRFTRLQAARTRKALLRNSRSFEQPKQREKSALQPPMLSGDFSDPPEAFEDAAAESEGVPK